MQDIHCHILPDVDDGSRDMQMSLKMLAAAQNAGVTSIVCTPHVRRPYFDYERMLAAYEAFKAAAAPFPVAMGWEVAHRELVRLGVSKWAPRLAFEGTNDFLLELDDGCDARDFVEYERTIFELQGLGLNVIIAHPERYRAIQKDPGIAENLVRTGCELQASADFVAGGRTGGAKRPAKKLFAQGLYRYIASDAHRPEHYRYLAKAQKKFADKVTLP